MRQKNTHLFIILLNNDTDIIHTQFRCNVHHKSVSCHATNDRTRVVRHHKIPDFGHPCFHVSKTAFGVKQKRPLRVQLNEVVLPQAVVHRVRKVLVHGPLVVSDVFWSCLEYFSDRLLVRVYKGSRDFGREMEKHHFLLFWFLKVNSVM